MDMQSLYPDATEILGFSDEDLVFRRVTEAVERCSLLSGLDFYTGQLDICVGCDNTVALPNDVETPLAVNIGGTPAPARDVWFQYNLNGPGSPCGSLIDWMWMDEGTQPVIQPIVEPSQIVAYSDLPEDNNTVVRIYGDGENDLPIRTLSPARLFPNKALTASFVQPNFSTPITVSVTLSDGFNANEEIIIQNATTGNLNYYRVVTAPTSTTVTLLQSDSENNDAAGTNFLTTSKIRRRVWEDGFLLPIIAGFAMPDTTVPLVKRVTRITKQETKGYIKIIARDTGRSEGSLLAIMYPKDTETRYRRIKIAQGCQWVRMRYRKKNIKIQSMQDQILCDSSLAIMNMLKSLQYMRDSDYENMKVYQQESLELLSLTQTAQNAPTSISVQYNDPTGIDTEFNMV